MPDNDAEEFDIVGISKKLSLNSEEFDEILKEDDDKEYATRNPCLELGERQIESDAERKGSSKLTRNQANAASHSVLATQK